MEKNFIRRIAATWLPTALLVVVSGMFAATTWYESAEEAAVRSTMDQYIKGAETREAKYFEKAFAVEIADMKYVRKDRDTGKESLMSVPIPQAIENWTSRGPAESWGKVVDVRVVDEKLAHATVELLWQGHLYVDVMSLYKVNGEWKIVNKTFVSRGPAKADES